MGKLSAKTPSQNTGFNDPYKAIKTNNLITKSFIMLKHNLLFLYRSALKYKGTFAINLIGLSIGLASALLIYLWVNAELAMDHFHKSEDRMYQVMCNFDYSDELKTQKGTPDLTARTLKAEMPEIEYAVQTIPSDWFKNINITVEEKNHKATIKFAEKDYFNIFSFDFIEGTPDQVLANPDGLVITESLAKRLFNTTEDIIGTSVDFQIMEFQASQKITGIIKDLPENTTEKFEMVVPFAKWLKLSENLGRPVHWDNYGPEAVIVVKEDASITSLEKQVGGFLQKKTSTKASLWLQPYADQYLHGTYENGRSVGGRISYVWLFSLVALFLILMACINFINLSTAKATRKLKEIGIKKTIGANRKQLITQYLSESVIISAIAAILAVFMVQTILPYFSEITAKTLTLSLSPKFILALVATTLLTGLLAGIYPAIYLSGFTPSVMFKGMIQRSGGEAQVRKGLVIFQFALSVSLIIGVIVMNQQINFIQSQKMGFQEENIIYFNKEGKVATNPSVFLEELVKQKGVLSATMVNSNITNHSDNSTTSGVDWPGKDPNSNIEIANTSVNYDFLKTLEIPLVAGRGFSKEFGSENEKLLLNEEAVKVMGLENPIGTTINIWGDNYQVIGVTKDFHFDSFHKKISPTYMWIKPSHTQEVMVRISGDQQAGTIAGLRNFYQSFTGQTLEFKYLDEQLAEAYQSEMRVATLSQYFAGLAVLIACLGLFGLAAFTAERRTKEIGIRKTLGATRSGIVLLLSKDFTKMVLLGIIIAIPLSYYAATTWLQGFAYHTEISLPVFILAGLIALFIAWITIGFQAIRAASVNPIDSLKNS